LQINATISVLDRGKNEVGRWGLGLIPFVTVPFDNQDDFFGDDSFTGGVYISIDRYLHKRHYVSLNVGTRFRKEETILNLTIGNEFLYGASYVYRLSCQSKWDLALEMIGSTTYGQFFSQEISSPYEGFISLRKRSQNDHWEWTMGAGRAGNNGYGVPDYHVYAGISYRFFNQNKPVRHCCEEKEVQEPTPVAVVENGTFEFEIVDQDNQPLVLPIIIVTASEEEIQNVTSNRIYRELETGTYKVIVNDAGKNHEIPFEIKANQTTKERLVLQRNKEPLIEYVDPIYFDVNKDIIKEASYPVLDHVIELIQKYKGIDVITINAHTDSDGASEYNLDLSIRRAESVKRYLIEHGMDESIIRTAGFGETQPRVANTTPENKALNRRVEFELTGENLNVKIINQK
ncbi:MAG: OmpA family protein, partial [Bdellovibrionales bacterium]|nr:OmpA family protein [Bdellovibrionales bacterium]